MNIKIQILNLRISRVSALRLKSFLLACFSLFCLLAVQEAAGQNQQRASKPSSRARVYAGISEETQLRIMRAEDERRFDNDLSALLTDRDARVRARAALAAGRIGDERAVPVLIALLGTDAQPSVRSMAAFALGETESASGADALVKALENERLPMEVRARSIEALDKVAAALPKSEEAKQRALGDAILKALASAPEGQKANREFVLLGLTAVLRARPANASAVVARFLKDADGRVRSDALNTLSRLKAKDANEQVRAMLAGDADPVVRSNAARVLGGTEDADSLDALITRAATDEDERVRVSAIRALGSLKNARAAAPLLERAAKLMASYKAAKKSADIHPRETSEMLEIATTLGGLLANTGDAGAVAWLREFREAENAAAPEIEIAFAHIAPASYLRERPFSRLSDTAARVELQKNWRTVSGIAQGLGEIATLTAAAAGNGVVGVQADAQIILRGMLDGPMELPALAVPDVLRALAAFKGGDLAEILRRKLQDRDVIVRATAAELLGELPPDEANATALANALPVAMKDELNDAVLSILDSLAKQKQAETNDNMKAMLDSPDQIVRRRAASLLKANGAGDFDARIGAVATRNKPEDYLRALSRFGKVVRAVVTTDKGAFTIELLPEDAPLNVDNFVQLSRSGYFSNVTFHRVVPNFVVQGGDPRGDGNGGPGYQIRCEINEAPYERGAVGMALSGKDTGGSQWFVTHSPQPHLDGGYTVFGRVVAGMEIVDQIARGDRIRSISVTETARPAPKKKAR